MTVSAIGSYAMEGYPPMTTMSPAATWTSSSRPPKRHLKYSGGFFGSWRMKNSRGLELIEANGMTVSAIGSYAMAHHYDVILVDYLQKIPAARGVPSKGVLPPSGRAWKMFC